MDIVAKAMRLSALLEKVGFALWQLAEVEDTAVAYFVIRLRPVKGIGVDAAQPILKAAEKRTFGWLVKRLKDEGILEVALASDLEHLVDERNWLVHRAKRASRGALNHPDRYDELFARIDRLGEDALGMQRRLLKEIETFVSSQGVSPDVVDNYAEDLRRAWGYE